MSKLSSIQPVSEYAVRFVPSEQCPDVWGKVKDLLRPAVERSGGRWTMAHVLSALVLGHHALWVVEGKGKIVGAFTTSVAIYPAKKFLAIHFLGGENLAWWYHGMSEAMVKYASYLKCDGIECNARMGLWKWFKDDGFEHESGFFERRI